MRVLENIQERHDAVFADLHEFLVARLERAAQLATLYNDIGTLDMLIEMRMQVPYGR